MRTKKLSLNDFTAVGDGELLSVKGGISYRGPQSLGLGNPHRERGGGGGGCAGDPSSVKNGTPYDMDEVVVTAAGPRTWVGTGQTGIFTSILGRILTIPGQLLGTQGLNQSMAWVEGNHWDPTSNC